MIYDLIDEAFLFPKINVLLNYFANAKIHYKVNFDFLKFNQIK